MGFRQAGRATPSCALSTPLGLKVQTEVFGAEGESPKHAEYFLGGKAKIKGGVGAFFPCEKDFYDFFSFSRRENGSEIVQPPGKGFGMGFVRPFDFSGDEHLLRHVGCQKVYFHRGAVG